VLNKVRASLRPALSCHCGPRVAVCCCSIPTVAFPPSVPPTDSSIMLKSLCVGATLLTCPFLWVPAVLLL
jgi:hypothetical protein